MSDKNINQNFNSNTEDEISLNDIVDFLIESWRTIFATSVLGLLGAVTNIVVTPNKYEATAQIQMAQLSIDGITGKNLEDPNLLIARMKMPSSYDQATNCGQEVKPNAVQAISKITKFSIIEGT